MGNKYDKIFKENVGEFFLSFSQTYLKIKVVKNEELKGYSNLVSSFCEKLLK